MKRTPKEKAKTQYGTVNVPAEAFERKNQKIRITMFVDGDVLDVFKARAEAEGGKYQTLMNEALRRQAGPEVSKKRELIERTVDRLEERLAAIEKALVKA